MNNIDKLAVVLVNYNGIDDTIECIKSIKNANERVQIIVVDNASKYDELTEIEEHFKDIKCIRCEQNGGFSAGNNCGIRWALSEGFQYVLLLNNDTVIDKDMITLLLDNVDEQSICVPKMLYYDNKDVIWYGGGEINKKTGNAKHHLMNCKNNDDKTIEECTFATGCCMLIPVSVFEQVGMLDESFFMYCEDTEFCIRLNINHISIKYVPAAMLWHKIGASTKGQDSNFSTYYMTRNRYYYIKKYKTYFCWTAYPFSVISRCFRSLQDFVKRNPRYKYFNRALIDEARGISGKVNM